MGDEKPVSATPSEINPAPKAPVTSASIDPGPSLTLDQWAAKKRTARWLVAMTQILEDLCENSVLTEAQYDDAISDAGKTRLCLWLLAM